MLGRIARPLGKLRTVLKISTRGYANIRDLLTSSSDRLVVLYGTHSGSVQKYAGYIQKELSSRFNVTAPVENLFEVNFDGLEKLEERDTLILLVSTYGDGEPNAATLPFFNKIDSLTRERLRLGFSYSILSRGSSLFDTTFAKAGLMLNDKLKSLGAHQISSIGIQDKISTENDDEYFRWKEELLLKLKSSKNLQERPFIYTPSVVARELRPSKDLKPEPLYHRIDPDAKIIDIRAKISQVTERVYVHADLNLPGFTTGDYIAMWPSNSDSEVEEFLDVMFGKESPRRHNFIELDNGVVTSYAFLAKHFIDIQGIPDRDVLYNLSHMAPTRRTADATREMMLASKRLATGLTNTLKKLSPDVPWSENLPVSAFFDILPKLEPRRYSVASSSFETPDWAGLTCVVEHDPETGFTGLATGELERIARKGSGQVVAVNEPLPSFRMPQNPMTPLLLFGVGTGVAPFRGFVRERLAQVEQGQGPVGPVMLFTGTRTPEDLVHHEEFQRIADSGKLDFELITSFSRVDPSHPDHGYISCSFEKHGDKIVEHIQNGAHIYICGDIRKVRSTVRNTLMRLTLARLGLPETERKPLWKKLTSEGRTHQELW